MYDRDSGQVFKEYVVPPPPPAYNKSGRDWSQRTDLPLWKGRSGKGVRGPRAMTETALHIIAENSGLLSEDHLLRSDIPARYLWRIWTVLGNRGTTCLQAWRVFSKILLAEDSDTEKTFSLYRFRQHICHPTEDLQHYTRPLESPSFDFTTYINIGGFCSFDTNELLALADLKNLTVLEIIQPSDELRATFPRVSDRLVRGWSEKPNPFPMLRILRVWGDDSVTEESLQYLDRFPALTLYDVNGARSHWSNVNDRARRHGWEVAEPLHGLQDSLLWYLMLFSPIEEEHPHRLRDMARNIDEGLLNFCQNESQPIRFVPGRDAPEFMEYISDSARSNLPMYLDAPANNLQDCKSFPFETWGFFLLTLLDQLSQGSDTEKKGSPEARQAAVAGKLLLPSKPMACLQLGHCGRAGISPAVAYVRRGLFATSRYTLYRSPSQDRGLLKEHREAADFMKPTAQLSNVETGLTLNRQKRRRMEDLLESFTRS